MQKAAISLFLIGLTFPTIGAFILSLELIPARFAVMHAALLGAAFSLLFNVDIMVGAMGFSILAGFFIARLSEKEKQPSGGYLGLVMTVTLALAFIIFYKANVHALEAFSLFWGSVLTLNNIDLLIVVLLSLAITFFILILFKEVQAVLFDRELAFVVGVPATAIFYAILVLVCLSIAVAIRVTGALLVDAVTILPALAARQVAKNLRGMIIWGAIFGVFANMTGLILSYVLDLPVAPTIILVGAGIVFLSKIRDLF